jgi:hypothetical protein
MLAIGHKIVITFDNVQARLFTSIFTRPNESSKVVDLNRGSSPLPGTCHNVANCGLGFATKTRLLPGPWPCNNLRCYGTEFASKTMHSCGCKRHNLDNHFGPVFCTRRASFSTSQQSVPLEIKYWALTEGR